MASYAPSYGSCATSIFNGNTEPRYEELRADRKAISEQISLMVNSRKPFAGRTVAEMMEAPIEEFDAAQEVDMLRLSIAVNVRSWVEKAHNLLDVNADVDRNMLGEISGYVERVRRYVRSCPFIVSDDQEMEARATDLPTKEKILPPKNMKRVRDESDVRLQLTPPPTKSVAKPNLLVNDD